MKKQFLSFLFVAVSSSALFAQVSFGPKLGMGISTFHDTKVPSGQTKNSYTALVTPTIGAVLNVQITDNFALRPELLYLQRAAKDTYTGGDNKTRVSYLEVPVNIAAGLQAGPGKVEVFAGPAIGFALGGGYKTESNSGGSNTGSIKAKKEPDGYTGNDRFVNPINFSLNFGLDYKFDNGLLVQVGYNLGLTNVNPHSANSTSESDRSSDVTKASAVNISVAYLFGGKK